MNNVKKYGFTNNGAFLLSGNPYIGFYNVDRGVAYVGKYDKTISLDNTPTIQNVIIRSDKFLNRLPDETLSLTYSLSDFIYQPGEFINGNSFDNKINKVYSNFLDTYRFCFMASSDLPDNYTGLAKVSATNHNTQFVWTSGSNNTTVSALSVYNKSFTPRSKIVYSANINSPSNNNTLIVANSANIFVYTINQVASTFNLSFSSAFVETNQLSSYGSLQFTDITNLSRYDTTLYVCDSGASVVYAYDISGVLSEDRALSYKFNLVDSINSAQGRFITPILVSSSKNTVYIYDRDTYTIFYYDTNFNLINSYKNEKLFSVSVPTNLAYYRIYDSLFVLTQDFKLVILDPGANATVYELNTTGLLQGEYAKKIVFSNTNSDILYLLSNKTIYKKFISNIYNNIGDFSFVKSVTGTNSPQTGDLLYDIDTLQTNLSTDNILLFGYNQFINYNEVTNYNALLK